MLSMERIAEVAEYSKGTVYQHFTCKEEILIQLCNQCMADLYGLFQRAASFEGSTRDRITAVFFAHQLWANTETNQTDMLQHLSMHGVREKVTEESGQKHDELEAGLFGVVADLVEQAIDDGDLPKPKILSHAEIVFGLWSLSTGSQLLQASDLELDAFGIQSPGMSVLRTMLLTLDGLQWKPLHDEKHLKKLLQTFKKDLFADWVNNEENHD